MRTDKGKAFVMRREGRSYREISETLGVAKSTLTNWFRGVDFSEAIKAELTKRAREQNRDAFVRLNRVRGVGLAAQYKAAEEEARKQFTQYQKHPLFVAGIMAYWGEGDKRSKHHVRITNTDPKFLQLFAQFVERYADVSPVRISLALFLYDDLDEKKCKRYWFRQLGVTHFHKTQILPGRSARRTLPYGTCTFLFTNAYFKRKLMTWIDLLPEIVLNEAPTKKRGHG